MAAIHVTGSEEGRDMAMREDGWSATGKGKWSKVTKGAKEMPEVPGGRFKRRGQGNRLRVFVGGHA